MVYSMAKLSWQIYGIRYHSKSILKVMAGAMSKASVPPPENIGGLWPFWSGHVYYDHFGGNRLVQQWVTSGEAHNT